MKKTTAILIISLFYFSCEQTADDNKTQTFLQLENLDSTVSPGDNFFQFANGRWLKRALIPVTESSAGVDLEVSQIIEKRIRTILEDALGAERDTLAQKVGAYYNSGMDSLTIERLGYKPMQPMLAQIDKLSTSKDIMEFDARNHLNGFGYMIAGGYVQGDEMDNTYAILNLTQAGIGLPDRDYYFSNDLMIVDVQSAYQNYMKKIFMLLGYDAAIAAKKVGAVYELERQLAKSHKRNVELLDPKTNYHKKAVSTLDKEMPAINWIQFFNTLGIRVDSVNVRQPGYYLKLNELLNATPVDTWKAYLKFHVMDDASPMLSADFVNARFDYAGRALEGRIKIRPRKERVYSATEENLDDLVGQLYVRKYFPEKVKARVRVLVDNLQKAFLSRIDGIDWMSDSTKKIAKAKLNSMIKKIGYPEKWRDFSDVKIDKYHYFENTLACFKNRARQQLAKVGKVVDKTEWETSATTLNAFYDASLNEVVLPAGILQFPLFDGDADDAINYGAIGMIIGHEMTHGFDDSGAQFDSEGNLHKWWSEKDYSHFLAKSKMVADLYSSFTMLDSLHLNGALTLSENIADMGGIAIAYDAFKKTSQGQDTVRRDGFTPDQRFFLSFAQSWRTKSTEEEIRQGINTRHHAPEAHRVNGPLMNFTPFYSAFHVMPNEKMYRPQAKRISIW